MSGKDVLTLLLIAYGFTRKIEIKTYRGEGNAIGYEIHAENENGESYYEVNCEGLIFNISEIINQMNERGISPDYCPFPGRDYPVRYMLNMYSKK